MLFVSVGSHHDVRLHKVVRSLDNLGLLRSFVGLRRTGRGELPNPPAGLEVDLVELRSRSLLGVLGGLCELRRLSRLWLRETEGPQVIYVINEECLFLLPLRTLFSRSPIIIDVYDSLSLRVPGRVKGLIARVAARIAWLRATRVIVTDARRLALLPRVVQRKAVVVENYPSYAVKPELRVAAGLPKILVTGSLHPGRGLRQLVFALERVPSVQVIAAGYLTGEYAQEVFAKHPQVEYRGVVSPDEALAMYGEVDAVFTFYEPSNQNNIYASPNKLYEALLYGRPVVMNCEVRVSKEVSGNRWGWVVPYHDTEALGKALTSLVGTRERFAARSRELQEEGWAKYSWESQEMRLMCAIEDVIAGKRSEHD